MLVAFTLRVLAGLLRCFWRLLERRGIVLLLLRVVVFRLFLRRLLLRRFRGFVTHNHCLPICRFRRREYSRYTFTNRKSGFRVLRGAFPIAAGLRCLQRHQFDVREKTVNLFGAELRAAFGFDEPNQFLENILFLHQCLARVAKLAGAQPHFDAAFDFIGGQSAAM